MLRDCIRVIWHVLALALVVGFAMGFVLNGGTKTSHHSALPSARTRRDIVVNEADVRPTTGPFTSVFYIPQFPIFTQH